MKVRLSENINLSHQYRMTTQIVQGDCLEHMKTIPDKSVDLFICDLPYAETNCKWDIAIDLEQFWIQFHRIKKSKKTACIHFCSSKFGYTIIKSWEKGFKMDMVWKKRNKTGGLQSRLRPMRNHEMVYFFYEQAPKYNRDKYHKRINVVKKEKVIEDTPHEKKGMPEPSNVYPKGSQTATSFSPQNPSSVLIEGDKDEFGWTKEIVKATGHFGQNFAPPNPVSVLVEEESDIYGETKSARKKRAKGYVHAFAPPNPASVLEEKYTKEHIDNNQAGAGTNSKTDIYSKTAIKEFHEKNGVGFTPPNPASVLEEPTSMYESTKVFIGKRNHQTEKPQDILEFFLKYYSDEGDTVLDPTMGSGSTGVACKKLGRNFIGFEMDPKIFKVAEERLK